MNHDYNKIIYVDEKRKDALWIDWTLGNHCNFSCSYCPDILHNGSIQWISLEECEKFVRKIIVHYSQFNKKYFIFNLLGGEPTVWRNLKKFCILVKEIAAENNVTAIIEILTNGGRTMRWWRSNYHLFDTFKITHHSEFADPRHTKELAEFLYETGNRCSIQVPMLPDNWDVCIRHINVLADTDVPYNLLTKTLLIDFGSNPYPYTDEQKNYIEQAWEGSLEKNIKPSIELEPMVKTKAWQMLNDSIIDGVKPSQILLQRKHSWLGWKCWVGIDMIQIRPDGYMKLGGACEVKYPGFTQKHISDNFEFPTEPVTCTQKWCPCAADILIRKEKIND